MAGFKSSVFRVQKNVNLESVTRGRTISVSILFPIIEAIVIILYIQVIPANLNTMLIAFSLPRVDKEQAERPCAKPCTG